MKQKPENPLLQPSNRQSTSLMHLNRFVRANMKKPPKK